MVHSSQALNITHVNLLLEQVQNPQNTRFELIPNQHIGCYRVSFHPQLISREHLASVDFSKQKLIPHGCPLLGNTLESMEVEGQQISPGFLRPELQPEVGVKRYEG